jgi:uracil-DNA glycosylase
VPLWNSIGLHLGGRDEGYLRLTCPLQGEHDVAMDHAKSLASEEAILLRRQALSAPHMRPLVEFTARLRKVAPAGVPDFDPFDGGVNAECLFLLEAPGARAVGSGFISRDNPDETASNFFALNAEAGVPRSRTVTWNAVPWYIGDSTRIRAATGRDLRDADRHLEELLSLLPQLKVVVLIGRKAQRLRTSVKGLAPSASVLSCPHPSPLSFNGRPERRIEMLACLAQVNEVLGSATPS